MSNRKADDEDTNRDKVLSIHEECSNTTRTTTPMPVCLEQRWKAILPHEWRLSKLPEAEGLATDKEQKSEAPDMASYTLPARQGIQQDDRVRLTSGSGVKDNRNPVTETHPTTLQVSCQTMDDDMLDNQDQASITSRELMPPPPIPPRQQNREPFVHSTDCEREKGISQDSLTTTRQLETFVQMAHYEQPQKPEREQEPGPPSLDAISWIPQAMTSNIANLERDRSLSRLSTRSPLYESQCRDKEIQGVAHSSLPPLTRQTESMADFITRIENEVGDGKFLDIYADQESMELMEYQQNSLNVGNRHHDAQVYQPAALNELQHNILSPFDAKDELGLPKAFETNFPSHRYEESATSGMDVSVITPVEGPNIEVDGLEMSMFWRPNQFSHI